MRLDKFLADHNIGSRKQIKEYVKNGRCRINGVAALKPDVHIDEEKDEITFDGNLLAFSRFHYYLLNKPQGVVSATTDNHNRTVLDILKEENIRGLSPCGRLDIDTEGLLLITDDGKLIHDLLSPRKHVDKTYEVHLKGDISAEDLRLIEEGVDIGDRNDDGTVNVTLPAKARLSGSDENGNPIVLLTISEGRFHQVKRMFEATGNEVVFLKRLSMGSLELPPDLLPGEYRPLSEEEINILKTGK